MPFRSSINRYCEAVGRTSAIVTLAGLGSFVFIATAVDIFR
jgi:hypothetical protein